MAINHGIITDFSVTKSGDIWIDVDEEIFYDIKYSDWESVFIYPNTESLMKLLPYWYPGCDADENYEDEYEDEDPYSFDWLKRVVIRCVEKTYPIETLHQIYLFIKDVELCYTGETYEDEEWNPHNCVEIGDEGWEEYYHIHIWTSPRLEHPIW